MASRKRKNRRKTILTEVKLRTSARLRKKNDENSGKAIDDDNNKEKESVLVSCSTPNKNNDNNNKKKSEKSKEKRAQKHLHQNQRKKRKLTSDSLKKTDDEKNGSKKGNKKDFLTKTTTRRKIDRSKTKKPRQRKVLEESYDSSEDGDDESSLASTSSVHLPVLRRKGDEDEDYDEASSSSSSEDEEISSHTSLPKRVRNNRIQRKKKNEESDKDDNYDPDFSRDSSSEEDDKVDKELLSQLVKSNKRSRKNVDLEDSSDDNDNATDDIDNTDVFSQDLSSEEEEEVVVEGISTPTKKTEKLTSLRTAIEQRSPLKFCQVCTSKEDEITRGPLKQLHVCWVSPDGKNKQCFNLDTLKKVALSRHKMLKDKNIDKEDGDKDRIEYLQPPHFRTPMEDDLKDQIALKFGRQALYIDNIDADHYTGSSYSSHHIFSASGDNYFSADAFEEHFSRYTKKQMGSTDMYCCPICYVEASRRLKLLQKGYLLDEAELDIDDDADGDDDKHEDAREELLKFTNDPITTLTGIDSDFNVAATFCFRYVSQVKDHLKQVHGIDCTTLDGNVLFKRYQIRQADGLLQQWLTKGKSGRAHPSQMRIYWNSGYSLDFLYLLHLVDNNGSIDQDVPESILETAREFSTSFPRRALKIWAEVSGPYLKAGYAEHDDDFIVLHEDEESYDGNSDSSSKGASQSEEEEEEEDPEMKIVNELRRRRGVAASTGSDSDASHNNSDGNINESDDKNDDGDIRDAWKKYEGKEQKKNNSRYLKDDDSLELVADDYFKARYEESESESEDDWLKRKKTFKTKKDRRDEKYRSTTLKRLSKSKKSISNYDISSSESSGLSSDDEKTGRKSIGVFIEGSTRIASQKRKSNHTTSKKKKISRTILLSSSEDEL